MAEPTPALAGTTTFSTPSFSARRAACNGAGTAKGNHGALRDVLAAFHGMDTCRRGHVFIDNLDDTKRGGCGIKAQGLTDMGVEGAIGRGAVKLHGTTGKTVGIQSAKAQIGIGYGRTFTATAIAGRAWFGNRRFEGRPGCGRGDRRKQGSHHRPRSPPSPRPGS